MIRDLLGQIDTGILGQIGLIAFMVAFAAVLVYTFTMNRKARTEAKNLPLSEADSVPEPRSNPAP